ncbi:MAG: hypothetical protein IJT50_14635 [Lentisphaeria bacterium]|nr:hypothetical protein [Lentisphaeria bacterium]
MAQPIPPQSVLRSSREMAESLWKTTEEMARRYEILSRHHKTTIGEFNGDSVDCAPLLRLIVVIDDLAALMRTRRPDAADESRSD